MCIRDRRKYVSSEAYNALVARLAEAEAAAQEVAEAEDAEAFAGMELKLCPKCRVRIEKNAGCDQMTCYRCGERFQWSAAQLAKPPKPQLQAAPAAAPVLPNAAPVFGFGGGNPVGLPTAAAPGFQGTILGGGGPVGASFAATPAAVGAPAGPLLGGFNVGPPNGERRIRKFKRPSRPR